MKSDVEALDQVDRLDREKHRLTGDADRLAAAVREAEQALADRRTEEGAAKARHDGHRQEERAAERRVEELRSNKGAAVRVLETGIGNADAAQRQVDRCDALIDEVETGLLGVLDALEAAQKALTTATGRRAQAEQVLETATKEMPPRIAQLRAQASEVGSALDAAQAALPAELRNRYKGIREKNRWPVSRLKNGSCDACHLSAPPQAVADLKKGRLLECHGCHRWLLLPGER